MKKCHIKNSNEAEYIKIYKKIISKLKENRDDFTNDLFPDDIEKSVNNEILLSMFEMYRESNERIIVELAAENNYLKNKLYSKMNRNTMVEKRISEISSLFKFEQYKSDSENKFIFKDESHFIDNGNSFINIINMPRESGSLDLFCNKSFKLADQLNNIRNGVMEIQTKLKQKSRVIEKLKYKLKRSEEYKESTISNCRTPDMSFTHRSRLDKTRISLSVTRWIPDHIASTCLNCDKKFGFFTRRHHCRKCGDVFCKNCCNKYEFVMPYESKVRVCQDCFKQIKKENDQKDNGDF